MSYVKSSLLVIIYLIFGSVTMAEEISYNKEVVKVIQQARYFCDDVLDNIDDDYHSWLNTFDINQVAKNLTYFRGEQRYYPVFVSLDSEGYVVTFPHYQLWWLLNDIALSKIIVDALAKAENRDAQDVLKRSIMQTRMRAVYLNNYFEFVEKSVIHDTMEQFASGNRHIAKQQFIDATEAYSEHLSTVMQRNEVDKEASLKFITQQGLNLTPNMVDARERAIEQGGFLNIYMPPSLVEAIKKQL